MSDQGDMVKWADDWNRAVETFESQIVMPGSHHIRPTHAGRTVFVTAASAIAVVSLAVLLGHHR